MRNYYFAFPSRGSYQKINISQLAAKCMSEANYPCVQGLLWSLIPFINSLNNMKKIIIIALAVLLIAPSVALASWWNPITWFGNWGRTQLKQDQVPVNNGNDLKIVTDSMPEAVLNVQYNTKISALNGKGSYLWSAENLPPGLRMNFALCGGPVANVPISDCKLPGEISGIPTSVGEYKVAVTVSSEPDINKKVTKVLTLIVKNTSTVFSTSTLIIKTESIPQATVGAPYSATVQALGTNASYSWSAENLPKGLSISHAVCIKAPCQVPTNIYGTPTVAGTYKITLTVKADEQQKVSKTFTLFVGKSSDDLLSGMIKVNGEISWMELAGGPNGQTGFSVIYNLSFKDKDGKQIGVRLSNPKTTANATHALENVTVYYNPNNSGEVIVYNLKGELIYKSADYTGVISAVDSTGSTSQGIKDVVNANNNFSFDFYSNVSKTEQGNIFFSPYSISGALAMTYEGAKGQTATEIKNVFHFPEISVLRPNFAAIYNGLNKGNGNYELKTANALWVENTYPLLQTYIATIAKYYGGNLTNLDFINQAEKSRLTINDWVANKTNDKIKDLLSKGVITPDTRAVLTNAVYFKAKWASQFIGQNTTDDKFILNSNTEVSTKMMNQTGSFKYGENQDAQILGMNYLGNNLSMLILLPKENSLNKIETTLNKGTLDALKASMVTERVQVSLPKFKFSSSYALANNLKNMGMPTAFNASTADFSGMNGTKDLSIAQVIHQAFIEVAEYGTEAAAATAVVMTTTAVMPNPIQPKVFDANHPFIFVIQQNDTGNILFMGRINNPTK